MIETLIHSIIPFDKIFENNLYASQTKQYVNIKGGFAEISYYEGKTTVSRVISTNPSVYLDKKYFPGSRFK